MELTHYNHEFNIDELYSAYLHRNFRLTTTCPLRSSQNMNRMKSLY